MVDETVVDGADQDAANQSDSAVAEYRLSLDVDIEDSGPCRKHVRVTIPRKDIDHLHTSAIDEYGSAAVVPGFRVGHVPKQLIEKRFRDEISDQLKHKLLVDSLEQLAEDYEFDPISEPNIDIENIEIPEEGDFDYEFDIETRPEFAIPDYKGLKIRRPTRETTDEDIDNYLNRFLSQYSELTEHDGPAEADDSLSLSIEFQHDGQPLNKASNVAAQIKPTLQFHDAQFEGFDELFIGATKGDTREADLVVSSEAESLELRGETVHAQFKVLDVKRHQFPELTNEFLDGIGVDSEEDLREEVKAILDRQVTYQQRQTTRQQVLEKITESADWDLPEDLVLRQVENALRRQVLEMQQAGFTTQDIQARENELRQNAVSTTHQSLKEHFVLDKIATEESIEVAPADIEGEIQMMAMQRGENPRRVRARMLKSGMIENLEAQIRERKAVDLILERATFEDYEMEAPASSGVTAVDLSICGLAKESSAESSESEEDEATDNE